MLLEACVNSGISALEAQVGGADRVELCENMADGGTTPSAGAIRFARERLQIGLFVMIRPRGADFLYSDEEFEIMQHDVKLARDYGADGVVFGILKPDGTIDRDRMGRLADLARPMGITCHRAFDMTRDPLEALFDLESLGIDRILTSGQSDSALAGAPLIRQLIAESKGMISVMPGHGVKEHNLEEVLRKTGAKEVHMYLTKTIKGKMIFQRDKVFMGSPANPEYEITIVDRERIRLGKDILLRFETETKKLI
jgi:copper homeostasis protein